MKKETNWRLSCVLSVLLGMFVPSVTHSAVIENPSSVGTNSGIGVISGWKCEAGNLTVRFNNEGPHLPLSYGSERKDVLNAGACDHANVGFVSIMNWANLGDGTHFAIVYDDGRPFANKFFTVRTLGEEPFMRGLEGECRIDDFPSPGKESFFRWNESTQNLVLRWSGWSGTEREPSPPSNGESGCSCESIAGIRFIIARGRTPNEACANVRAHCTEYAPADGPACTPHIVGSPGAERNLPDDCGKYVAGGGGDTATGGVCDVTVPFVTDMTTGLFHDCE